MTNKMTARIKILQKERALDDTVYRAMLKNITGKKSTTKMADAEKLQVIQQLSSKSWKRQQKQWKLSYNNKQSRANYIAALFHDACALGHFNEKHERTLHSFVERQTGIGALPWLKENSDFDKVIHALKAIINKSPKQIPNNPKKLMTYHGCHQALKNIQDTNLLQAYKMRLIELESYKKRNDI